MGGPYNIPRNYKGEGKILYIFSTKSFLLTGAGALVGIMFFKIFEAFKLGFAGWIMLAVCAFIGFAIGTFKIPESGKMEIMKKTGGENIDQVILRWIKFKQKKKRIYIYKEGDKNG